MNAATFEGKGIDPKAVIDLAETMPFLAPCRVIELQDSGFAQNACPELADYIPDIPESTCLILTESDVDRRGRVYKAVKKYGRVVEFKRQDQRTLVRWVLGTLKQEGRSITEETMMTDVVEAVSSQMDAIIQVSSGIDQISSVVQTNSATSEETAAASEQLSSQSQIMDQLMARFKLKRDTGFVPRQESAPVSYSQPESYSDSGMDYNSKY